MTAPKPRRTADRILDVALALFNRFGESNVSTSQLCGELGMSPGNLFYHHPTRDALVAGLFGRYQARLDEALDAPLPERPAEPLAANTAPAATPLQPALMHLASRIDLLATLAWDYRFLFRDLNDLVSRHRVLEEGLPRLLRRQARCVRQALVAVRWAEGAVDDTLIALWSGHMLACVSGCIGLDGALDPRERLRGGQTQAVGRASGRALGLLLPALSPDDRHALRSHLSEGGRLGADPWWLQPPGE